MLHYIAGKRLAAGRLTVIDATNVQPEARAPLVALAREHDVLPVAIVLNPPESVCVSRNAARPDRDFGAHVIRRQHASLRKSLRSLQREGFRTVHVLLVGGGRRPSATITRTRLYNDLRHETGPFDVIGDVHGCRAELESAARVARLRAGPGRRRAARRARRTRTAGAPCSSATWWTAGRTPRACCGW